MAWRCTTSAQVSPGHLITLPHKHDGYNSASAVDLLCNAQSWFAGLPAETPYVDWLFVMLPAGMCKKLPGNGHIHPKPWQVLARRAAAGKKAVRAAGKPGEGVAMGAWCKGRDLYVTKKLEESN